MSSIIARRHPANKIRKTGKPKNPDPKVRSKADGTSGLLREEEIKTFLEANNNIASEARAAADLLVRAHPEARRDDLVRTLRRLLETISRGIVKVFFSYKLKDQEVAEKLASKLRDWSGSKLEVEGMERFAVEQPGQEWRKKIFKTIRECDWFLLLLPSSGELGDERDWVLLEAGYYLRGQDLAGRLVCLHHPENDVANALEDYQAVPANERAVKAFLEGLFHEPNWIPGMPPLNENFNELDVRTKEIVDLIQPPVVKTCCGPHMEVRFSNASAVQGWDQLAAGVVVDCNDDCRRLFGLNATKTAFGDWFKKAEGYGRNEGWVEDLAGAIRALGEGYSELPQMRSTIKLAEHLYVLPKICAVKRRKKDDQVEAIDFLFKETQEASTMNPDLAALALTLQFAVPLRYQVLENYASRKLTNEDILSFNGQMNALRRQAAGDPRFGDPRAVQAQVISLFRGEDKTVVQKMYDRAGQMWRQDGMGEVDRAIANLDGDGLANLIQELLEMNKRFLIVTSRRFAELIAQPSRN